MGLVAGEQSQAEEDIQVTQNVIQIVSLEKHEGEEDDEDAWTLKVRGSGLKEEKDWVSMLPVTYGRDTDSPIPPMEPEEQFQHDDHFEKRNERKRKKKKWKEKEKLRKRNRNEKERPGERLRKRKRNEKERPKKRKRNKKERQKKN